MPKRCAASRPRSGGRSIACLARCHRADLEKRRRGRSSRPAQGRIHTFIATSDLHLKAKLRMTREQCLEAAVESVRYARHHTFDVEFSAEDAPAATSTSSAA